MKLSVQWVCPLGPTAGSGIAGRGRRKVFRGRGGAGVSAHELRGLPPVAPVRAIASCGMVVATVRVTMKILCPTDFSPRSREAARIALGIAQRASGSVELVHVL